MPNRLAELLSSARDFAQGASNNVAGAVTAPVDGLAWLLRKGGLPIPENPVGGSDWARQQGLTAEPQNKLMGILGDAAGMAMPLSIANRAPEIAGGLLKMGQNLAAPTVLNKQAGAIVWHGSPHKFPPTPNNPLGEFDFSKIGTGEGAQAYGHGGYLAESPDVAKSYQSALTHSDDYVDGKLLDSSIPKHFLARILSDESGNVLAAKESLQALSRPGGSKSVSESAKQALQLLESGHRPSLQTIKPEGSLYKVDLPDNAISRMLDYDNPVPDAFRKPLSDAAMNQFGSGLTGTSGEKLYKDVIFSFKQAGHPNPTQAATDWLTQQGVPGMKYLDGGSRGAGAGTQNFVVFPKNESLLKILSRNGQDVAK